MMKGSLKEKSKEEKEGIELYRGEKVYPFLIIVQKITKLQERNLKGKEGIKKKKKGVRKRVVAGKEKREKGAVVLTTGFGKGNESEKSQEKIERANTGKRGGKRRRHDTRGGSLCVERGKRKFKSQQKPRK